MSHQLMTRAMLKRQREEEEEEALSPNYFKLLPRDVLIYCLQWCRNTDFRLRWSRVLLRRVCRRFDEAIRLSMTRLLLKPDARDFHAQRLAQIFPRVNSVDVGYFDIRLGITASRFFNLQELLLDTITQSREERDNYWNRVKSNYQLIAEYHTHLTSIMIRDHQGEDVDGIRAIIESNIDTLESVWLFVNSRSNELVGEGIIELLCSSGKIKTLKLEDGEFTQRQVIRVVNSNPVETLEYHYDKHVVTSIPIVTAPIKTLDMASIGVFHLGLPELPL